MKNDALQYLKENNLLEYGTLICREEMERALEKEYVDGWFFLGPFLQLKEDIEDLGYQCTSRNCEQGELYILPFMEFIQKREDQFKNFVKKHEKREKSCHKIDQSELSKKEREELRHLLNKMALLKKSMKNAMDSFLED